MLYLIVYDRRDNLLIVRRIRRHVVNGLLVDRIELTILLDVLDKKTKTAIIADLKVKDEAVCWVTEKELRILEVIDYFAK